MRRSDVAQICVVGNPNELLGCVYCVHSTIIFPSGLIPFKGFSLSSNLLQAQIKGMNDMKF